MSTNAPRMVTVLIALALLAAGLALTVFDVASVTDTARDLLRDNDLDFKVKQVGWASLVLSNLLLVVGSLFKGV